VRAHERDSSHPPGDSGERYCLRHGIRKIFPGPDLLSLTICVRMSRTETGAALMSRNKARTGGFRTRRVLAEGRARAGSEWLRAQQVRRWPSSRRPPVGNSWRTQAKQERTTPPRTLPRLHLGGERRRRGKNEKRCKHRPRRNGKESGGVLQREKARVGWGADRTSVGESNGNVDMSEGDYNDDAG